MSDDLIEHQKTIIKWAVQKLEDDRQAVEFAIWNGHELGMNVTDLAQASGRSRQAIYDLLEREAKRRDMDTRHKRIRAWVREHKGIDVPETGSIAASIIEDYDNWVKINGGEK